MPPPSPLRTKGNIKYTFFLYEQYKNNRLREQWIYCLRTIKCEGPELIRNCSIAIAKMLFLLSISILFFLRSRIYYLIFNRENCKNGCHFAIPVKIRPLSVKNIVQDVLSWTILIKKTCTPCFIL